MSEAPDTESADDFDLTDVPMDGDDAGPAGDEGQDEAEAAKKAAENPKTPLAADELEKRNASLKVALATERAKRRETDRRLAALESRDVGDPAPRQQRREPEPETEIDPDVDPVGALKQMRGKIAAYEAAERIDQQTDAQRRAEDREVNAAAEALSEHEIDFREDHPDYDEAAKHYAVGRAQELMAYGLEPGQIQPMLRKEFATLTRSAIRAGKNPAAVVYEMAKGRGYGKAAEDPKKDPPKPDPKLAALQRGKAAGSPLGGSGGRPSSGLDAATVANINIRDPKGGEAFDKAWARMEAEAKRAERGR